MYFSAELLIKGVKLKRKSWTYFVYEKNGLIVRSDLFATWEAWSMDLLANDWEIVP